MDKKAVVLHHADELIHPEDYPVMIEHKGKSVELNIISSPGGNVEGGYETSSLRALINDHSDFRFAIFPEDFLNSLGKVFGLEDVVIGYPDFDKTLIIKTNDKERLKQIFSDESVRKVFQSLSGYSLKIDRHHEREGIFLDFTMQRALIDVVETRLVFNAFLQVLSYLD